MSPFFLSLKVAIAALCNIVVVGIILAYLLKRYRFWGTAFIESLLTLPLVLPPVVVGFFLLMIFTPGRALGAWLDEHHMAVVFTLSGAVMASSVVAFPLFFQSLRTALQTVDRGAEDVARTLGASELRIYLTISLPLAWRGLVTGAMLSFSRALGEFGATIMIAGNIPGLTQTMPLSIYSDVEAGTYGAAALTVFYICALTLSLLCMVHLLTKKK